MARFPFLPRYLEPPVVFLGLPLSYHLLFSFPTPRFHPHDLMRTHTDAGIATIFSNRQQPRHE